MSPLPSPQIGGTVDALGQVPLQVVHDRLEAIALYALAHGLYDTYDRLVALRAEDAAARLRATLPGGRMTLTHPSAIRLIFRGAESAGGTCYLVERNGEIIGEAFKRTGRRGWEALTAEGGFSLGEFRTRRRAGIELVWAKEEQA